MLSKLLLRTIPLWGTDWPASALYSLTACRIFEHCKLSRSVGDQGWGMVFVPEGKGANITRAALLKAPGLATARVKNKHVLTEHHPDRVLIMRK